MTQRENALLALFRPEVTEHGMRVGMRSGDSIEIPLQPEGPEMDVQIWNDACVAQCVSREVDEWFSDTLSTACRLVYMPDSTMRHTHPDWSEPDDIVGFADAFPVLVAGEASLRDLNSRLDVELPMNRFRPNIVVESQVPFEEDAWPAFHLNGLRFHALKQCGRCIVTTTNQDTAEVGVEPLKTLAKYRLFGQAVCFGMYFAPEGELAISVGDSCNIEG